LRPVLGAKNKKAVVSFSGRIGVVLSIAPTVSTIRFNRSHVLRKNGLCELRYLDCTVSL